LILTLDMFAWAEMIQGSDLGLRAREFVNRAERCLTPSTVLAEVASLCVRDGFADPTIELELAAIREASGVVLLDDRIVIDGAHLVQDHRASARTAGIPPPGLAGPILATARRFGSRLLTGDRHFLGVPDTIWLADPA
jgi:hypothetical protein